ncbi:rRNA pseudouridine synthase [Candidatus Puniceispirillum sp.]|nr:rRNA pseudouridine synthase [Candidatus Puniceispirillum sp.]
MAFPATSKQMTQKSFTLDQTVDTERIAKRIARAGICSRREAESRILEGRVQVNGEMITSPALNVNRNDKITIDGKPLPAREPAGLWRYYKSRGLIVSDRDEQNRETIFDRLPKDLPRLITVGRLDLDSEGLLLMTNDGDLARHLELPSTGWSRKYRVRAQGQIDQAKLAALADGVTIEGIRYGQVIAKLDRQMASNAWLTVAIREGKNREIRRIMDYLGHKVSRLIRISYGPFQLGKLEDGDIEAVKARVLADQLGIGGSAADANDKPNLSINKPTHDSAGKRVRHANHSRKPSRGHSDKTGRR